ncbi:hypothetical protein FQZ97_643660 [compost metagenome]
MQRYDDTKADPLPIRSEYHEQERQRVEQATAEFLTKGGKVQEIGFQMKEGPQTFVIDPKKTPVYAHLFQQPEAEPIKAKPLPRPLTAQVAPEHEQPAELLPGEQLAARLMVQAALGASPKSAAKAIGITEKHARQIARDFRITFTRQR